MRSLLPLALLATAVALVSGLGLGEFCGPEPCDGDLFCDVSHSGRCTAPLLEGDPCQCGITQGICRSEDWQPCDEASGLICQGPPGPGTSQFGGVCVVGVFVPTQLGGECDDETASDCADGLSCSWDEDYVCWNVPREAGQACGDEDSVDGPCAEHLMCTSGVCVAGDGIGSACTPSSPTCQEGQSCHPDRFGGQGHCFDAPRLLQQPCGDDDPCASDLECDTARDWPICVAGGFQGDPHMTGFNGHKFDYNGVPGQAFSLVSAPGHFQVNALIMPDLVHGMTYVGAVAVTSASGHYAVLRADASVGRLTAEVDGAAVDPTTGARAGDLLLERVAGGDVRVTVTGLSMVLEVHDQRFLNLKSITFTQGVPPGVEGVLGHTARPDRQQTSGLEHEEAYYYVDSLLEARALGSVSGALPRRMSSSTLERMMSAAAMTH